MYNKFIIALSLFCMSLLLVCNCAFADSGHAGGSGHFGGNGSVPSYNEESKSPTFTKSDFSNYDFSLTTDDFSSNYTGTFFPTNSTAFLNSSVHDDILHDGFKLVFIDTQYLNFDIYFYIQSSCITYFTYEMSSCCWRFWYYNPTGNLAKVKYRVCIVYRDNINNYLYNMQDNYFSSAAYDKAQLFPTSLCSVNCLKDTKFSFIIDKITFSFFNRKGYLFFCPFYRYNNIEWHIDSNLYLDFLNTNSAIDYVVNSDAPGPLNSTRWVDSSKSLSIYNNPKSLSKDFVDNLASGTLDTIYYNISVSSLFDCVTKEDFNTIISDNGKNYLYMSDYSTSDGFHVSSTGNLVADTISNIFNNYDSVSSSADLKTFLQTGLHSPFLDLGYFGFDTASSDTTVNLKDGISKLDKLCAQYASLNSKSPYVATTAYIFKIRCCYLDNTHQMTNLIASSPLYYVFTNTGISQFMSLQDCISYGFLPSNYTDDTKNDITYDGTSDLTGKDRLIINNIVNPGGSGGSGGHGGTASIGDININVEGSTANANNEGITVNGSAGGSANYGGIDLDSGSLSNFGGTVKDINNGWGLLGSNGAIAALSTFWGWFDKQGVLTNIFIYLILFGVVIGLIKIIRG